MKNSGFTLIEFILVLVLILTVTTVAVEKFSVIPSARVNAAARTIVSDIRYTQSLAISTQKKHRIVFTNNSYSIEENNGTWQAIKKPLSSENFTIQLNTDYAGVIIDSSYIVEFNMTGEPVTGGGGSFTISYNSSPPQRTINIQTNTGRTTIN